MTSKNKRRKKEKKKKDDNEAKEEKNWNFERFILREEVTNKERERKNEEKTPFGGK
jgi:hypothetical protein